MALLSNSRLWSNLVLFASVACVAAMFLSLVGIRQEWFSAREASGYIRYGVQAGLVILVLSVLVIVFARKNIASLIKGILALVIILTPMLIAKNNMPAGTAIFPASRPAGPPGGGGPVDLATAPINDITTDTLNPPVHVASVALRSTERNGPQYGGESVAAIQAVQFPDIKPITSSMSKSEAFEHALDIADDMNWEVIAQDPSAGTFEAVSSTVFLNYKDDVVVRITESGEGSIVDIRSHSREGRGDRGKNAERVRAFISQFGS